MVQLREKTTPTDEGDDSVPCGICGECISHADEALECARCERWIHRTWSTVGKVLYDALSNDETEEVVFLCAPCVRKQRK